MLPLCQTSSREEARDFGLVLESQRIGYAVDEREGMFEISVSDYDLDEARDAIHLYIEENREASYRPDSFSQRFHRTYSGLFVAALMFTVHTWLPPGDFRRSIVDHYGASAADILNGQVYRLVTALFLHADDLHLAGNMAGIVLFGTSVAGICGPGLGWLMILASGILGNGLNAWFYKSHHLSIGSSTAIFGALGILAGCRFIGILEERGLHVRALIPLGAGLALLGLLGVSERADLTAHLFGYAAGLACGMGYAAWLRRPPRERIQVFLMLMASVISALSFYIFRP